jgi:hypothetical protein
MAGGYGAPAGMPAFKKRAPPTFAGLWMLDTTRSQPIAAHLEGMGLPELSQAAATQVTPAYEFRIPGDGTVTIRHMSEIGEKERTLRVGVEHSETAKDGAAIRMLLEMPAPHVLVTHIDWGGRGRIDDTRTLCEDVAGNPLIHQHIEFLHAKGGGKRTVSERYFVRGEEAE